MRSIGNGAVAPIAVMTALGQPKAEKVNSALQLPQATSSVPRKPSQTAGVLRVLVMMGTWVVYFSTSAIQYSDVRTGGL
jgi:hypothetical protein